MDEITAKYGMHHVEVEGSEPVTKYSLLVKGMEPTPDNMLELGKSLVSFLNAAANGNFTLDDRLFISPGASLAQYSVRPAYHGSVPVPMTDAEAYGEVKYQQVSQGHIGVVVVDIEGNKRDTLQHFVNYLDSRIG